MVSRAIIIAVSLLSLDVGIIAIRWSNKLSNKPPEHAYKSGCYVKEIDDVLAFNETVNALGFCYLIHCTEKQIDYISCGVNAREHDSCIVFEALSDVPYPQCCPRVQCFEDDLPWDDNQQLARRRIQTLSSSLRNIKWKN